MPRGGNPPGESEILVRVEVEGSIHSERGSKSKSKIEKLPHYERTRGGRRVAEGEGVETNP